MDNTAGLARGIKAVSYRKEIRNPLTEGKNKTDV